MPKALYLLTLGVVGATIVIGLVFAVNTARQALDGSKPVCPKVCRR